jgi:hypothetical protein
MGGPGAVSQGGGAAPEVPATKHNSVLLLASLIIWPAV